MEAKLTLLTGETLFELAAGGVDIGATAEAYGRLHPPVLQAALKILDLLHRRGLEWTVRNVVQLDEIDVTQCSPAEVAQGAHLGFCVVDALDHGELIGRAASRCLGVLLERFMET